MDIIFYIIFLLVICVFVVILVKNISQWVKNNNSPRLSVDATVVTKRTHISHHHHNHGPHAHVSHSSSYYVTFQVQSGDRMELHVSSYEYGQLAEGDRGVLHFQGTRYQGFDRI